MNKYVKKAVTRGRTRRHSINLARVDRIALSIAWMQDEIGVIGVAHAIGAKTSSNGYNVVAIGLKMAFEDGIITVHKGRKSQ